MDEYEHELCARQANGSTEAHGIDVLVSSLYRSLLSKAVQRLNLFPLITPPHARVAHERETLDRPLLLHRVAHVSHNGIARLL